MANENNVAYYAVIPATVRYDKEVPPNAKLLYGEITALCSKEGVCWAGNAYFSDLYGVSDRSVQRWIDALVAKGYILRNIQYEEDGKTILRRCLSIGIACVTTPRQNCRGGYDENVGGGHDKNVAENNTRENNTREYLTDCQDGRGDTCDDDFDDFDDDDDFGVVKQSAEEWYLDCIRERLDGIRDAFKNDDLYGSIGIEKFLHRFENVITHLPTPLVVNGAEIDHAKYLEYIVDFFRCPPKEAYAKLEDVICRVDEQATNGVVKNRFHYLLSALLNASQGI